jgi:tetraacyldisaccharide 4'-kinase
LVVVGSLRIGGGAKTPVAALLAKQYAAEGKRVAILAHAVERKIPETIFQVHADSDWRLSSDEAVWLAQETGLPVWVTRDRWKAWHALDAMNAFDVIVSDDGLEDARLQSCRRILLDFGDSCRHWWHTVPVGRCRSLLLDHPGAEVWSVSGLESGANVEIGLSQIQNILGCDLGRRESVAICGIGDPSRFCQDLLAFGVNLVGFVALRDHSHDLEKKLSLLLDQGEAAIVITAKDWAKLPVTMARNPRIFQAKQAVRLGLRL